jgi:enoyl-CoA hydratase/carnithine racemase
MSDHMSVTVEDGVADVRLTRRKRMNALDEAMFEALVSTGQQLKEMAGLRAVVLSGDGKAFCVGLDMRQINAIAESGGKERLLKHTAGVANRVQQAVWVWREIPVPVIAAVHDIALGGGFQLALGADMRFVRPDARFSVMEVKWGLVPDMAGTQLMRHLAREDVVRELTYTGRVFSGEEALAFGFATRLCEDPRAEAFVVARDIAQKSPDAVRAAKRLLNSAVTADVAAGLRAEAAEQSALVGGFNQREAVAANLAKRPPQFVDPPTSDPTRPCESRDERAREEIGSRSIVTEWR